MQPPNEGTPDPTALVRPGREQAQCTSNSSIDSEEDTGNTGDSVLGRGISGPGGVASAETASYVHSSPSDPVQGVYMAQLFATRGNQFEQQPQNNHWWDGPELQLHGAPAQGSRQRTADTLVTPMNTFATTFTGNYGPHAESLDLQGLEHLTSGNYPANNFNVPPQFGTPTYAINGTPSTEFDAWPAYSDFLGQPQLSDRPAFPAAAGWLNPGISCELPMAYSPAVASARQALNSDWAPISSNMTVQSDPSPFRLAVSLSPTPDVLRDRTHLGPPMGRVRGRAKVCGVAHCMKIFERNYELERHHLFVHAQAEQHYHCKAPGCVYMYPRWDKMKEHCHDKHAGLCERLAWEELIREITDDDLRRFAGCVYKRCSWYQKRLPYLQ